MVDCVQSNGPKPDGCFTDDEVRFQNKWNPLEVYRSMKLNNKQSVVVEYFYKITSREKVENS